MNVFEDGVCYWSESVSGGLEGVLSVKAGFHWHSLQISQSVHAEQVGSCSAEYLGTSACAPTHRWRDSPEPSAVPVPWGGGELRSRAALDRKVKVVIRGLLKHSTCVTQEHREARPLRAPSGGGSGDTCTEEGAGGMDGVRAGKGGWMKITDSQMVIPSRPGKESDWDVALSERLLCLHVGACRGFCSQNDRNCRSVLSHT